MTHNPLDLHQPATGPIPFAPRPATNHTSARTTNDQAPVVYIHALWQRADRRRQPITPPALTFRITGFLLGVAVVLVALAAPEGIWWRIAVAAALLTYAAARAIHAWRAAGAVLRGARDLNASGR